MFSQNELWGVKVVKGTEFYSWKSDAIEWAVLVILSLFVAGSTVWLEWKSTPAVMWFFILASYVIIGFVLGRFSNKRRRIGVYNLSKCLEKTKRHSSVGVSCSFSESGIRKAVEELGLNPGVTDAVSMLNDLNSLCLGNWQISRRASTVLRTYSESGADVMIIYRNGYYMGYKEIGK